MHSLYYFDLHESFANDIFRRDNIFTIVGSPAICLRSVCYIAYANLVSYSDVLSIVDNFASDSSQILSDGDNDLYSADVIYMHMFDGSLTNGSQVTTQRRIWIKPGYFAHIYIFLHLLCEDPKISVSADFGKTIIYIISNGWNLAHTTDFRVLCFIRVCGNIVSL